MLHWVGGDRHKQQAVTSWSVSLSAGPHLPRGLPGCGAPHRALPRTHLPPADHRPPHLRAEPAGERCGMPLALQAVHSAAQLLWSQSVDRTCQMHHFLPLASTPIYPLPWLLTSNLRCMRTTAAWPAWHSAQSRALRTRSSSGSSWGTPQVGPDLASPCQGVGRRSLCRRKLRLLQEVA